MTYYRILDKNLIGRSDDGRYYLWIDGNWKEDVNFIIMDRLMGYDPSEPDDSPYGFGSTDMLSRIEGISEKEALKEISEIK